MNVSHARTASDSGRQQLPDQLRGFALLGIVLVNMPFLGVTNAGLTSQVVATPLDTGIAFAILTLAQGKFYLLFALLFGYSFSLMLRDDTSTTRARYLRRLLGLLVLGAVHAYFFFIGDILMSYAVLGFAMLALLRRSTRTLLVVAAISFATGVLVLALIVLDALNGGATGAGIVNDVAGLDDVLATGTFLETVIARAAVLPEALLFQVAINWLPAFSMFALGLAVGRTRLFADPRAHRRLWRGLVATGLTIGLPLAAVSAWFQVVSMDSTGVNQVIGVAIGFATAPALTAGYVGAFALLTSTRWARGFSPAGRMSLTGYLGESVLLAAVFCGWGLGLFGTLPLALAALVAIGAWLALDLFAVFWMRRFRYGPLEYLLRWWSTLRRPSFSARADLVEH